MVGMLDPSMLDPANLPPYNPLLDETLFSPGAAPPGLLSSTLMMPPGIGANAQLPPMPVSPAAASSFASAAPPSISPSVAQGDQPPVPTTSLLGRILNGVGNFANNNPMTLMALGGGLAGAPSLGTGISRGLTAAAPALNLDRQRQIQQAMMSSTYSSIFNQLVSNGMPRDQAANRALGMTVNPEMFKQLAPSAFGPGNAPTTTTVKDSSGIEHTLQYDPTSRTWQDIPTGRTMGATIGNAPSPAPALGGGAPATVGSAPVSQTPGGVPAIASPQASTAPTGPNPWGTPVITQNPGFANPIAPPPSGVNIPGYIQGATESSVKDAAAVHARGTAALETIQKLNNFQNMAREAPEDAFGMVAGSDRGQILNRIAGEGPAWSANGPSGNALYSQHERLKGGYASMLEPLSRFISAGGGQGAQGGVPRNANVLDLARETIGGTDTSDKTTALQRIDDYKANTLWDAVADDIRRGGIDPHQTPLLQHPKSPQEAQALGRGALYIAPDGSVRQNPK